MCVEDEKLICNNGGFTPVYYLVSILCYIQEVSSVERESEPGVSRVVWIMYKRLVQ